MSALAIREATKADAALIYLFVCELARYERAEQEVIASIEDVANLLFGENSNAYSLIVSVDGVPIGYAVYFYNYSTWLGKKGLYLEDLYISPDYRGIGAGKAMMKYIAAIAVKNNCGRFELSVLNWNESAIDFYESIGAKSKAEWIVYRLDGDTLKNFAAS